MDFSELIESIKKMNIQELNQFSEELRNVFSISQVDMGNGVSGDNINDKKEESIIESAPQKDEYTLSVIKVEEESQKIRVMGLLKIINDVSLSTAKDMLSKLPCVVKENCSKEECEALSAKFVDLSCICEIK